MDAMAYRTDAMACRRSHERSAVGTAVFTALAALLLVAPAAAQAVDSGKYPDLKGQWVRVGRPNNWSELAGPPPLTPEYQKIFDDIKEREKTGGYGNWPSTFCVPAGMPALMSFYDPAEIVVTPDTTYVLISHNDDSYRRIYTDGRDWPAEPEPTFAGYSIGKWVDEDGDGKYDALEVETRYLKLPRSYDTSGIPFHEDGEAVIKERIYLDKNDRNTLYNQITVIDHALTRPYVKLQAAKRNPKPHPVWLSDVCSEHNNWVRLGDEAYYLSIDGKLMPSRKGQPPPDLRYFKQSQK
jgi:hypothetical protein